MDSRKIIIIVALIVIFGAGINQYLKIAPDTSISAQPENPVNITEDLLHQEKAPDEYSKNKITLHKLPNPTKQADPNTPNRRELFSTNDPDVFSYKSDELVIHDPLNRRLCNQGATRCVEYQSGKKVEISAPAVKVIANYSGRQADSTTKSVDPLKDWRKKQIFKDVKIYPELLTYEPMDKLATVDTTTKTPTLAESYPLSFGKLDDFNNLLRPTSMHQVLDHFSRFTMPNKIWLVKRLRRKEGFYKKYSEKENTVEMRKEGYLVREQMSYDDHNYTQITKELTNAPKANRVVRWDDNSTITVSAVVDLNLLAVRGLSTDLKGVNLDGQSQEQKIRTAIENRVHRVFSRLEKDIESATGLNLVFVPSPKPDSFYTKYDGDPFQLSDITIHFRNKRGWSRNRKRSAKTDLDGHLFNTYEIVFPVLFHQYTASRVNDLYSNSEVTKDLIGVSVIGEDYKIKRSICNAGMSFIPEDLEYQDKYIENCLLASLGVRADSDFYNIEYKLFLLNSLYHMKPGLTYGDTIASRLIARGKQ